MSDPTLPTLPPCCKRAVDNPSVFWVSEGDPRIDPKSTMSKSGWAVVRSIAVEMRGVYWLANVDYCPYCGTCLYPTAHMPTPEAIVAMAQKAYAAYGKTTNFKNYQGLPMPEWADLPEQIKEAWMASTLEVYMTPR